MIFRRARIHPIGTRSDELQLMEENLFNIKYDDVESLESLASMIEDGITENKITSFPFPTEHDSIDDPASVYIYLIDFLDRNRAAMQDESIAVLEHCVSYVSPRNKKVVAASEISAKEINIKQIGIELSGFDSPTIALIFLLLLNINEENEKLPRVKSDLAILIEHVFTELEILNNSNYTYPIVSKIEETKNHIKEFLVKYSTLLQEEHRDALQECISMLDFIGEDEKNIEAPLCNKKYDLNNFIVQIGPEGICVRSKVQKKLRDPYVKCPACHETFSKFAHNVIRKVGVIKCPKCNQSIAW